MLLIINESIENNGNVKYNDLNSKTVKNQISIEATKMNPMLLITINETNLLQTFSMRGLFFLALDFTTV